MQQIHLTANLRITSDEYDVSINSSGQLVRVAIDGKAMPVVAWNWLRRLFRYRKMIHLLAQQVEVMYKDQLIYKKVNRNSSRIKWMTIIKLYWRSLFTFR